MIIILLKGLKHKKGLPRTVTYTRGMGDVRKLRLAELPPCEGVTSARGSLRKKVKKALAAWLKKEGWHCIFVGPRNWL